MGQVAEIISEIAKIEGGPTTATEPLNIAALIPSLKPGPELTSLVREMQDQGFAPIVVIDDGSGDSYRSVFDEIAKIPGCDVLQHAVNLGKGRGLKTGFNHILVHYPGIAGVVTVDADGQHRPDDALKVAQMLLKNPKKLVLGARVFGEDVPWKSKVGNVLTRWMFKFFVGRKVSDTQTGLRGIPRTAMAQMLSMAGERYEYEMNMLVNAPQQELAIVEQPIKTVYFNDNKGTHFNPVIDSMRVGFVLARFYLSSVLAAAMDLGIFALAYRASTNVLGSLMFSRFAVGGLVNFALNRRFVFHSRNGVATALVKYYVLLAVSGIISYAFIQSLVGVTHWNVILCKVVVDVPLSLFNFSVQRTFVFGKATEESN